MTESIVRGRTLPQTYHDALLALSVMGDEVPCPDYKTSQREVSMTMCISQPLAEPMISRLFIGGPSDLEQYRQEMLDGILDFEVEKGNWKYTYHRRYSEQYQFVIDELKRNPYSRRAVMDIRSCDDIGSDDPACWQHAQYLIRNGALHCKVLFRSNDAVKAAFMNAFALIMLQKRIADELEVEMGTYTHRANSFHVYARDYDLLDGYVDRIIKGDTTTFSYEGEWKELMEDERVCIAEKVSALKEGVK